MRLIKCASIFCPSPGLRKGYNREYEKDEKLRLEKMSDL